jgi:hypothetical protein
LCQISDLHLAAVDAVSEKDYIEVGSFYIFIYATLGEVGAAIRLKIDAYYFHIVAPIRKAAERSPSATARK